MSKWTTKIRVIDSMGRRPPEIIERFDDEDTETMLKICQIHGGSFIYEGYQACSNRPCINPITREIWYVVELFGKADE